MKSKLTIKQIIQKLDKIQVNNAPNYIQGMKSLKDFIDKQNCYIKLGTLAHHKKQLYRLSSTKYLSTYSREDTGITTTYYKQFIEDCLKISLCLKIGLRDFEESTNNRMLIYNCK